ncbi:MAG: outer membrane lipoprotein-sorting protein [Thermoanaerobaculia bacterium]
MKTRKVFLRLSVLALFVAPLLHAATPAVTPTAAQILSGVDRTRNGWNSFVVDVKIDNFKNNKAVDQDAYQVYIKGSERTLVKFMSPEDRGKTLLMLDQNMWLYLPSASRPIRVTPLQRLSGNASNGDIAQTNLAANYNARFLGDEMLGARDSWMLELKAKGKGATYQVVRLWVGKSDLTPIKAEFRLQSGKPIKRVEYLEYVTFGTQKMIRRQVMYDLLRNEQKTVVEYANYQRRELADKMFNRNSLR